MGAVSPRAADCTRRTGTHFGSDPAGGLPAAPQITVPAHRASVKSGYSAMDTVQNAVHQRDGCAPVSRKNAGNEKQTMWVAEKGRASLVEVLLRFRTFVRRESRRSSGDLSLGSRLQMQTRYSTDAH